MEKLLNLKKIRKEHKLTQAELAAELGISFSGYWGYENGTRKIPPEMLKRIADFFGVSIDNLLGHETNEEIQFVVFTDEQTKSDYDTLTDAQREQIQQLIKFFKEQNNKNNSKSNK